MAISKRSIPTSLAIVIALLGLRFVAHAAALEELLPQPEHAARYDTLAQARELLDRKTPSDSHNGQHVSRRSIGVPRVDIRINSDITHQTMAGFGTSERVFDDPHLTETFNPKTGRSAVVITPTQQDEILDKLYVELGLTRVRSTSPDTAAGSGIEPVNDNDDPNVTDLKKFNFSWKNLDDHCAYFKRAWSRGLKTAFLSPANRESWMGVATTADAAEYAEWLLAQIKRCDALGVRLPFVSIGNEPSYKLNSMSGGFVRDAIKILGPRLRAEGFQTMFVVPDDIRPSDAAHVARVVLADATARSFVGALATHLYDEDVSHIREMQALSSQYGLPLWMTEYSSGANPLKGNALSWANLMQDLIGTYDVSAIDYMWGFFGQWDRAQLIVIRHQGNTYTGYDRRKEYYVMGQYSRFIKPGSVRVAAHSNDGVLKVTAFKDGSRLVIVVVNNAKSRTANFEVSGANAFRSLRVIRTTLGAESWATRPAIVVNDQRFAVALPGRSITTFVSGK
jgi:O-glycosyl hydrolase